MIDDVSMLSGLIRQIPDYPKPGVIFRDLTPLFTEYNFL